MYNSLRGQFNLTLGGVVEWFKALVLKTSVSARAPWVRIPPPPYQNLILPLFNNGGYISNKRHMYRS